MEKVGIVELLSAFGVSIGGLIGVFINMYTTNKVQNEKLKSLEKEIDIHGKKLESLDSMIVAKLEELRNEIHELGIKLAEKK